MRATERFCLCVSYRPLSPVPRGGEAKPALASFFLSFSPVRQVGGRGVWTFKFVKLLKQTRMTEDRFPELLEDYLRQWGQDMYIDTF